MLLSPKFRLPPRFRFESWMLPHRAQVARRLFPLLAQTAAEIGSLLLLGDSSTHLGAACPELVGFEGLEGLEVFFFPHPASLAC